MSRPSRPMIQTMNDGGVFLCCCSLMELMASGMTIIIGVMNDFPTIQVNGQGLKYCPYCGAKAWKNTEKANDRTA